MLFIEGSFFYVFLKVEIVFGHQNHLSSFHLKGPHILICELSRRPSSRTLLRPNPHGCPPLRSASIHDHGCRPLPVDKRLAMTMEVAVHDFQKAFLDGTRSRCPRLVARQGSRSWVDQGPWRGQYAASVLPKPMPLSPTGFSYFRGASVNSAAGRGRLRSLHRWRPASERCSLLLRRAKLSSPAVPWRRDLNLYL